MPKLGLSCLLTCIYPITGSWNRDSSSFHLLGRTGSSVLYTAVTTVCLSSLLLCHTSHRHQQAYYFHIHILSSHFGHTFTSIDTFEFFITPSTLCIHCNLVLLFCSASGAWRLLLHCPHKTRFNRVPLDPIYMLPYQASLRSSIPWRPLSWRASPKSPQTIPVVKPETGTITVTCVTPIAWAAELVVLNMYVRPTSAVTSSSLVADTGLIKGSCGLISLTEVLVIAHLFQGMVLFTVVKAARQILGKNLHHLQHSNSLTVRAASVTIPLSQRHQIFTLSNHQVIHPKRLHPTLPPSQILSHTHLLRLNQRQMNTTVGHPLATKAVPMIFVVPILVTA